MNLSTPEALRTSAEYQRVASAVSDLLNAHPCALDELRWAWRTAALGSWCHCCAARDDINDPTCWPVSAAPTPDRYGYQCARCGTAWAVTWASHMLNAEDPPISSTSLEPPRTPPLSPKPRAA